MCLRFAFLLTARVFSWLRLSQREDTWKTTEILILRHQLAVLQRRQARRPNLNGVSVAVWGARTRADHLSSASTLGTRALSPHLSVHDPVVRLAGAPRAERYVERRGDPGVAARGRCPAPSGRPPEAGLGRPCRDHRVGAGAAQTPSAASDRRRADDRLAGGSGFLR